MVKCTTEDLDNHIHVGLLLLRVPLRSGDPDGQTDQASIDPFAGLVDVLAV